MVEQEQPVEQPKVYTLKFTREEILERIRSLSKSENIEAFLKAEKGKAEYEELQQLIKLVQ